MRRGRLGLSAIDECDIWSRWEAGQTLHEIGRAYGKCHKAIRAVLLSGLRINTCTKCDALFLSNKPPGLPPTGFSRTLRSQKYRNHPMEFSKPEDYRRFEKALALGGAMSFAGRLLLTFGPSRKYSSVVMATSPLEDVLLTV